MYRQRPILAGVALTAFSISMLPPALACGISIPSSGSLRINQLSNPTVLGSEVSGSTPATVTMILPILSGIVVDVERPVVTAYPAGYNLATSNPQVAYNASILGLLNIRDQTYTTATTQVSAGGLGNLVPLTVTLTLHNRVINTSGFPGGAYTTRTTITCHPG
jgi:hypothetical protein